MEHLLAPAIREEIPEAVEPADELVPKRPRLDLREWDWMSRTLQEWRVKEDIPMTSDIIGSSCISRPLPLTGECTIPILEDMGVLKDLRENAFEMTAEQEEFDQALHTTCDQVVETERRLVALEHRTVTADKRAETTKQSAIEAEHRATAAEERAASTRTYFTGGLCPYDIL
ncbi:hypothetical protein L1987_43295 [Smallanthus sonchifolius]|uniref:Uncharacterized protein n=1 Tax=Smallanthus sonchifolius TaxID=185202 RepID=A0ACB9GM85_9ASTR|nr:hypothetical protein L1987_43295 [Smallanthus sonchifolius]